MKSVIHHFTHPLLAGFVIASVIALFVRYGISFTLYLLHTWQVSTFHTIVFYAFLFVLAKAGVLGKSQRRTLMGKPSARLEAVEDQPKRPSGLSGVLNVIWTVLAIYSVLWLTPALIIYWMCTYPYPNQMIGEWVVLLSVVLVQTGCRSASEHRESADKVAGEIIAEKQVEALGRTEPFG
ncbi:MAG: hypothetical protein V3S89_12500, partial [Desulfobacterales bacterium]